MSSERLANPRRTTMSVCAIRGEGCAGAATRLVRTPHGDRPVCASCAA